MPVTDYTTNYGKSQGKQCTPIRHLLCIINRPSECRDVKALREFSRLDAQERVPGAIYLDPYIRARACSMAVH